VIASIVATDLFFFLRERNFKQFMKEMSLKVAPFVLGMLAVFFYHYLYSGNFFKYYEVQSTFWTNNLQWPTKLADWSIEGYGMNIAAVFLVTVPGLIYFFSWRAIKPVNIPSGYPSVFKGNITEIKRYFWLNSIVYFAGFLLYILMFRGGSLHCFHRFIISSPYFFLFILILFERMPHLHLRQRLLLFIPGMVMGLIFIVLLLYQGLHFKDSGFILFSLLLLYVMLFDKLRPIPKFSIVVILALYAILWYTFLYNNYISCAWIFA
ncbi:MAG: hypothetical protein JXA23_03115, partial [Bacteroidales bacterium]|nr:hypothetical protein [Bacteroidales bacterium]